MSIRHVLGVLEDDESRVWATFDRAVELADAEQARLTLAKTTDPGRLMRWFGPAGLPAMCVSVWELDFRVPASRRLAAVAEFVPAWIPVTTLLLAQNTTCALTKLMDSGSYDALVATDVLLAHRRRLRRALTRVDARTVLISCQPASRSSGHAPTSPRTLRAGARGRYGLSKSA